MCSTTQETVMKKLLAFVRKSFTLSSPPRGFADLPMWLNVANVGVFSAWLYWLRTPTGEAFREFNRIAAVHGIDWIGWLVLGVLLLAAISLLCAAILAAASLKAIVDRLQKG
jgi:hypothetical protein